jgi:hypothetical protein
MVSLAHPYERRCVTEIMKSALERFCTGEVIRQNLSSAESCFVKGEIQRSISRFRLHAPVKDRHGRLIRFCQFLVFKSGVNPCSINSRSPPETVLINRACLLLRQVKLLWGIKLFLMGVRDSDPSHLVTPRVVLKAEQLTCRFLKSTNLCEHQKPPVARLLSKGDVRQSVQLRRSIKKHSRNFWITTRHRFYINDNLYVYIEPIIVEKYTAYSPNVRDLMFSQRL